MQRVIEQLNEENGALQVALDNAIATIARLETRNEIILAILAELAHAEHLYPVWPDVGHRGDHVWAAGILAEEAGEVLKAALDWQSHGRGSVTRMRQEAVQAAAMALRFLQNLDAVERQFVNESVRQGFRKEYEIYTCGHGCGLRYMEPPDGMSLNEWEWWSEDNPIHYPVKAEGLVLADYTEGCNQ